MTLSGHFTLNFHCYETRFQHLGYILIVEPIYRIFLRGVSIALLCKPCTSYDRDVSLSVRLSVRHTLTLCETGA